LLNIARIYILQGGFRQRAHLAAKPKLEAEKLTESWYCSQTLG